jgi:hypothetical protein
LKALIFHFAKIYWQKSALMTAQRDLGNSPSDFDFIIVRTPLSIQKAPFFSLFARTYPLRF